MAKIKDIERILNTTRKKELLKYKRTPMRLSTDFSAETLQARKQCRNIFKVMKEKQIK